jgi:ABC-type sulfate transport system substrate-binding protein
MAVPVGLGICLALDSPHAGVRAAMRIIMDMVAVDMIAMNMVLEVQTLKDLLDFLYINIGDGKDKYTTCRPSQEFHDDP